MGDGWRGWFLGDGRLRALWRVLLFAGVFMLVLFAEMMLLSPFLAAPVTADRVSAGLVLRTGLVLAAALLAGWAMLRWVDRRPLRELGFGLSRRVPAELAAGLAIGALALTAAVLILAATDAYGFRPDAGTAVGWIEVSTASLLALAIPAAAEEALFRGYLLRALVDGGGPVVAVALTSLLFAAAHGSNPGVGAVGLVNIFLAGVLLAVAVLRTASLWFASALHLGWNWAMAGPLDLPVSGLESYDIPLYDAVVGGPGWLTGGGFGPEGGLAGTIAVTIAFVLVLWTTRPGSRLAAALMDRRAGHGNR